MNLHLTAANRYRQATHCSLCLFLFLFLVLSLLMPTTTAQMQGGEGAPNKASVEQEVLVLEPGKPTERKLAGGEAHAYEIQLSAGEFLQVSVVEKGIDVGVTLFGSDDKQYAQADYSKSMQGFESMMFVAAAAGRYRLEVRSSNKDAAAGHYEVKIAELRPTEPQDKDRIVAHRLFAEGLSLQEKGDRDSFLKAIEKFEQAAPLFRAIGDKYMEAYTLNITGVVYSYLEDKRKALDYYEQALPLYQAIDNKRLEAFLLIGMGDAYNYLGETQQALDHYNLALRFRPIFKGTSLEAVILNNLGTAYNTLDEKQKALDCYKQALAIAKELKEQYGVATTLNNIGEVYNSVGEARTALDFYQQALPLYQAIDNQDGEATVLSGMGFAYEWLGEIQRAIDYYDKARLLFKRLNKRFGEASTLHNMGMLYNSVGKPELAREHCEQALSMFEARGDRNGEAMALNCLGSAYNSLGDTERALEYYNRSLPLRQAVGNRSGEAATLYKIAHIERDRGNLSEARAHIESSIELVESIRAGLISRDLRASYFVTGQSAYAFYIDLLMLLHRQDPAGGYDRLAFEASERARARSLLELLAESRVDIRQGVDEKLVEKEKGLQQKLKDKADKYLKLKNRRKEQQAAELAGEIDQIKTALEHLQAQIKQQSPQYAALTQPTSYTLPEIQQQVLDDDTLLLEFFVGKERSYLWLVTATSMSSYELPKQADIAPLAKALYASLKKGPKFRENGKISPVNQARREYIKTATKLSELILAPVAGQLNKKRIMVVADGMLHYIPFAALPEPQVTSNNRKDGKPGKPFSPLNINHEVINESSASVLVVLRQQQDGHKAADKTIAVLADPVFGNGDKRIKGHLIAPAVVNNQARATLLYEQIERAASDLGIMRAGESLPRLPFTGKEAKNIAALLPGNQSRIWLDFEANLEQVTSENLSPYQIIHFATHGLLNTERPELTALALSLVDEQGREREGFLTLNHIFNLSISAELVTLSACDTGLGKEVRGEGLIGLTRGFMYAGAKRVMVSLWNANDRSTVELMTRFYRGMVGPKRLRPSAALRAAQLSMMREPQWNLPYYWAVFQLQGEW